MSDAWKAKWGSLTLCLRCLEKMHADSRGTQFVQTRVLWDHIVLALALIPFTLVLWFAVFITAPAALILGIWSWKKPNSLLPHTKLRLIIGMLIALAQIGLIGVMIVGIFAYA